MEDRWLTYCSLIQAMLQGDEAARRAAVDWLMEEQGEDLVRAEETVRGWVGIGFENASVEELSKSMWRGRR